MSLHQLFGDQFILITIAIVIGIVAAFLGVWWLVISLNHEDFITAPHKIMGQQINKIGRKAIGGCVICGDWTHSEYECPERHS
jgi:nitrogen fixation-related uncharacterized protein